MSGRRVVVKVEASAALAARLQKAKTDAQELSTEAARERAQKKRKVERRRRFLLGAWVVSMYGADLAAMPDGWWSALDAYLKSDRDRAAFGLTPLGEAPPDKADPTGVAGSGSASGAAASDGSTVTNSAGRE